MNQSRNRPHASTPTPNIVSISPTAIPKHAYAGLVGGGGSGGAPSRPTNHAALPHLQERAKLTSIDLSAGLQASKAAVRTPAQQRAAAFQDARRQCGQRPQVPDNHRPISLVGLRESDMRKPPAQVAVLPRRPTNTAADDASTPVPASATPDVPSTPSVADLARRPWELPRVDKEAMKDPYLRSEGLHRNDIMLQSHIIRRIVGSKTFHETEGKVDFNTKWY